MLNNTLIAENEEKQERIENLKQDIIDKEFIDLPFFCRCYKRRLKNKYDFVWGITGGRGNGKSTLEIESGYMLDDKFDLKKNLLMIPNASMIKSKFNSLDTYQVLGIDEASRSLHKHTWYDKVQQEVNAMYDTERYQYKGTMICIPNFWNLTPNFRNERVDVWIHVFARGWASIAIPDKNRFTEDPWHQKENMRSYRQVLGASAKIIDAMSNINKLVKAEKSMDINVAVLNFPPLDPEIQEAYDILKIESRAIIETPLSSKDVARIAYWKGRYDLYYSRTAVLVKRLHDEFKVSYTDIGRSIGVNNLNLSHTYDAADRLKPDGDSLNSSILCEERVKSDPQGGT